MRVKILVEPYTTTVCRVAFIEEPFVNRVCLHQRKDGTAGESERGSSGTAGRPAGGVESLRPPEVSGGGA